MGISPRPSAAPRRDGRWRRHGSRRRSPRSADEPGRWASGRSACRARGRRRAREVSDGEGVSFGGVRPLRRAARPSKRHAAAERFVASALGIKSWSERTPTCAEARPGTCPCCGAATPAGGRAAGDRGARRSSSGRSSAPERRAGRPERSLVQLRRYRCRACRAILVVGPRGLVRRPLVRRAARSRWPSRRTRAARRVLRCAAAPARRRVVGGSARERWVTLARWLDAARRGELFGVAGSRRARASPRRRAGGPRPRRLARGRDARRRSRRRAPSPAPSIAA